MHKISTSVCITIFVTPQLLGDAQLKLGEEKLKEWHQRLTRLTPVPRYTAIALVVGILAVSVLWVWPTAPIHNGKSGTEIALPKIQKREGPIPKSGKEFQQRMKATGLQLRKNKPYEVGELLFFDNYINNLIDQKLWPIIKCVLLAMMVLVLVFIGIIFLLYQRQKKRVSFLLNIK